jgi:hypothetical protein
MHSLMNKGNVPQLMYRNHQPPFPDTSCREALKHPDPSDKLATVFDRTAEKTRRNLLLDLQEPKAMERDITIRSEIKARLVTHL